MEKISKQTSTEDFQWPSISYENLGWQEKAEKDSGEFEPEFDPHGPTRSPKTYYQAALPLLIAERSIVIPEELSTRISAVLVEMARFDVELAQRADNVPTMLLRSESSASSQIGRLMSNPQSVALAELYAKAPESARLVVANMDATKMALELPEGLTLEGIAEINDVLAEPELEVDKDQHLVSKLGPKSDGQQLDNPNTLNALIAQGKVKAKDIDSFIAESKTVNEATSEIDSQMKNESSIDGAEDDRTSQSAKNHTKKTNQIDSALEKLRQKPVWFGGASLTPHSALIAPPAFHRVPEYMVDLIEFGTRSDLNPLVKAAIFYAQFATVHPFLIANGQTGRALIHHIFREDGVLSSTIIPVSVGFLHNIDSLINALHRYQKGDPIAIIEELVKALEVALFVSRITESSVESLLQDWDGLVGHRKGSKIRQLPKTLVKQPVVNSAYLANALGVTQRTATTLILKACEYGMLRRMGKKERGDFYQSDAIINVLDKINEASTFRTIRLK